MTNPFSGSGEHPGGQDSSPARSGRRVVPIAVMIVLPVLVATLTAVLVWSPAHPKAGRSATLASTTATTHFLLALGVVLGVALICGRLATLIGQPAVVGEILAGLLLGPSVLGSLAPHSSSWLFPAPAMSMLKGLSELGLILFMAGVGREFALYTRRSRVRDDLLVAGASLLIPFAAGVLLAASLGRHYLGSAGSRPGFVLFLGCVLGVTAFPVLARLIADAGLNGTRIGQLSMYSAAVGDGAAWIMLLVVGVCAGSGSGSHGLWAALATVAVLVLVITQSGRLAGISRLIAGRNNPSSEPWVGPVVVAVTLAGAGTAFGGVHEIIGSFVSGILLAQLGGPTGVAVDRLVSIARSALFPVFLVLFGMAVDFGAVSWTGGSLGLLLAIVAIGTVAKVSGAGGAARVNGMSWRDSLTVG
ncbi:MAG: cation:proton antiporter, partial [Jatrophihabitantaceae bacterium]